MSVYIITDRAAGVCKIGYSQMPKKRLTMLRTSSAADLQLEAVIPGDLNCERDLHAEHSAAHVRREWFTVTDAIEALIAAFPVGESWRERPRGKDLARLCGISKTYASDILVGRQPPSIDLAVRIFRATGWKHDRLAALTASQIDLLAEVAA